MPWGTLGEYVKQHMPFPRFREADAATALQSDRALQAAKVKSRRARAKTRLKVQRLGDHQPPQNNALRQAYMPALLSAEYLLIAAATAKSRCARAKTRLKC